MLGDAEGRIEGAPIIGSITNYGVCVAGIPRKLAKLFPLPPLSLLLGTKVPSGPRLA